jgi:hypothetical protein
VQRDGDIDVVLRCMEDEFAARPQENQNRIFWQEHYMATFSELWIGSVYETIRLVGARRLVRPSEKYEGLAHDLRLLRIPLEKHEIAAESRLKEPLRMTRFPPNEDRRDLYEYDKREDLRAHIQPSGLNPRSGSVIWHVTDLVTGRDKWLERREISDRVLDFWMSLPRQS